MSCILPFIQLATKVSGELRLCCFGYRNVLKGSDGRPLHFDRDSLEEIWNSAHMRDLRMRLLKGEKIPECEICWKEESLGRYSKRMNENRFWNSRFGMRMHKAELDQGYLRDDSPVVVDLRPTNVCNLKCRSCNPNLSTKWIQEVNQSPDDFREFFSGPFEATEWISGGKSGDNFRSMLADLREIRLSGGEPLLASGFVKVLRMLAEEGHSANLRLKLNTNGTKLTSEIITILRGFAGGNLMFSIDGYGEKNDFLRSSSKYEEVEDNLCRALEELPNLRVGINCTVSVLNIFSMADLVSKIAPIFRERDRFFWFCTEHVYHPRHLSFFPFCDESLVNSAFAEAEACKPYFDGSEWEESHLENLQRLKIQAFDHDELKKLGRYLSLLDQKRKENTFAILPEFGRWFERHRG